MTSIHVLEPGDILATGTNHRGLSSFQDGDKVELECEGMGKLVIGVRDDLKDQADAVLDSAAVPRGLAARGSWQALPVSAGRRMRNP
jgi:hypothetical protein